MKSKGRFIVFEGIEGSGKSTQVKLLADHLRSQGRQVLVTQEPGGTPFGAKLRDVLLNGKDDLCPETETLLYMASRSELVERVIAPALKAGKIVISDRWLDATLAYQGYGSGVDITWIRQVAKRVVRGAEPDATIFLTLTAAEGLRRARQRGKLDRIESRALVFHRRVEAGYRRLARGRGKHTIPSRTIEQTHAAVRKIVDRLV